MERPTLACRPFSTQYPAPAHVDTDWFRDRLAAVGMTQRELARRLDLDPSAVSLMLRGRRQVRLAEVERLSDLLAVQVEEVMIHVLGH